MLPSVSPAHNLDSTATSISFANDFLDTMGTRAGAGQALIQVNDEFWVLLKTTPGPGTDTGVGGYQTFYIPDGVEVIDAAYVYPDAVDPRGFRNIPIKGQSSIGIGNGSISPNSTPELIGFTLPGTNGLGLNSAPVSNNGTDRGTLAGVYADTGIFYSTDPRTAFSSYMGAPMTNNSGDTVGELYANNINDAQQRNVLGVMSLWDSYQLRAYGRKDVSPIIDDNGRGNAPWGLANAVAGPQSGYAWEFDYEAYVATAGTDAQKMQAALKIGPWNRVKYPGSQMSKDTPGLISNQLGQVGVDASLIGVDATTIPNNATAVRFSLGQLEIGRPELSAVKVRIVTEEAADTCIIMHSDAFGGDAGGTDNGKDHIWRYFDPTVVVLNPCTFIQKVASKTLVSSGEVFHFDISFANTGNVTLPNVTITDTLPSGLAHVSSVPTHNSSSGSNYVWNIGTVAPGEIVTIRHYVRATGKGTLFNTATARSGPEVIGIAQQSVEVGDRAILLKSKVVNTSTAAPGDLVTYTLEIENIGTGKNGTPLVVREFLPQYFTYDSFVNATLNGAAISSPTIAINSSNTTQPAFTINQSIDPGKKLFINFRARIALNAEPGTYFNSFQLEYEKKIIPPIPEAPVTIASATIGDTVWYDWNGDGAQGPGEDGIPGVTVELYAADGTTLITTTTTDSNGNYYFTGLNADDYVVKVIPPTNSTQTGDPDAVLDNQHSITLVEQQQYLIADFGYQPTGNGTIGDTVFEDVGNDGTFTSGIDIGISGVSVSLYIDTNGDGILDPATDILLATTTTGIGGSYSFANLALGFDYLVIVDPMDAALAAYFDPDPYQASTPIPQVVSNLSGNFLDADFGFWRVAPAAIGDTVFADNDGNGLYDPLIDDPIGSATVNLYRDGVLVATTTSAPDGTYLFDNLGPGTYDVIVDSSSPSIPDGYAPTISQYSVTLVAGETFLDADFPYAPVISKAVDLAFANPGDTLNYTININSLTSELLNSVTVTDALPEGTSLVSVGQGGSVEGGITEATAGVPGSHPGAPASGTATLTAVKDTSLNEDSPTLNYGASTSLTENRGGGETLGTRQVLVQFDLTQLPAGATLNGAQFRLTKTDTDNPGKSFQIYPLLKSWDEGTGNGTAGAASFNLRLPGTYWGGGTTSFDNDAPSSDYGSQLAETTVNGAGTYTWTSAALLTQVQNWFTNPANNFGLVMGSDDTGTDDTVWNSRESSGTKPQLVVDYTSVATPSTTTTLSVTPNSVIDSGSGVNVTVTMTVTASGAVTGITPSALSVIPGANGANATLISGPTGSPANIGSGGGSAVFTWTYNVTSGAIADEVLFSGGATGSGAIFESATSNGVIVTEPVAPASVISWNLGSTAPGIPGGGSAGTQVERITPIADTEIWILEPNTNQTTFELAGVDDKDDDRARLLLQFDLSILPAAASVSNATLRLLRTGGGGGKDFDDQNVGAHRLTAPWIETQATWNSRQTGNLWTTPGADFVAAPESVTLLTDTNQDYFWNVTNMTQDWVTGAQPNHGVIVKLTNEGLDSFSIFAPRESTEANSPYLDVTFTAPSVTTEITTDRTLVSPGSQITVSMTVTSPEALNGITAPTNLTVSGTNGVSATKISGPTPTSGTAGPGGLTFTWVYQATGAGSVGNLTFAGSPSLTGYTWTNATSNEVIVSPPLTFQVTVNNPPPASGVITNVATINIDGTPYTSNEVETFTSGTIGDFVWADLNGDGIQDAGEFGIGGVTVLLYAADGVTLLDTAVTAFDGSYRFINVPAGDYVVTYDSSSAPGDYFPTTAVSLPVTLASGQQYVDADFGLDQLPPGTGFIGDYVWMDRNNDGIQDVGEPGISDVTVILERFYNGEWLPLTSTVTDANGAYGFAGLSAGDYRVTIDTTSQISSPYSQITYALGDVTQPTFDADGTGTPHVALVTLATDTTAVDTMDFGYNWSGSIGDFVWWDYNTNGLQDELPLVPIENARVQLYFDFDFDGDLNLVNGDNEILRVFTDANGAYLFTNMPPGNYFVDVYEDSLVEDDGVRNIVPTTADVLPVILGPGNMNVDDADFGYFEGARIDSLVFWDDNNNGVFESGETILAGVTVTVTGTDFLGNPVNLTGTTTADGYIPFLLSEGDYTVTYSSTDVATLYPSLTLETTPLSFNFAAQVGEDGIQFFEFGVTNNGAIGDTIFADIDGNGTQGPGEPGMPNVTVNLYLDADGDGIIDFDAGDELLEVTITDENGYYLFTALADTVGAGQYVVEVVTSTLPSGYLDAPTAFPAGADIVNSTYATTLTGGETIDIVDFGYPLDTVTNDTFYNLSGTVYHDNGDGGGTVGDGLQNGTEPGLGSVNVRIEIDANNDGIYEQSLILPTDINGFYSYAAIPQGADARVTVLESTLPNIAFVQTGDPDGAPLSNVWLVSNVQANVTDVDFGYLESLGSIAGTVVVGDGNGTADIGEPPVDGVLVTLISAGPDGIIGTPDDVIDTTLTDVNGNYQFTGLLPGPYEVFTGIPSPYHELADADGGNPNSINITLDSGDDVVNRDFEYQTGSLSGIVWTDSNADGVLDVGETFISGVTVFLDLDGNGVLDSGEPSTTTDANGFYEFTGLNEGSYVVRVDPATLPSGIVQSYDVDGIITPNVATVSLAPNQDLADVNYGYYFNASISGNIAIDTTGDLVGDTPQEGIVVELRDELGNPVTDGNGDPITTVTDPNGNYTFPNVPPGNYQVVQVLPPGFIAIDDVDEGDLTIIGDEILIEVISGVDVVNQDFVNTQLGSIAGVIEIDTTGDGLGDTPQANVTVALLDDNGAPVLDGSGDPIITTTALDGTYNFTDLPPGDYQVAQTVPTGFTAIDDVDDGDFTIIGVPTPIGVLPGADVTGQDFVNAQLGSISGTVLVDTTGDGIGDTPQVGVVISLLDGNGQPVLDESEVAITTVTDGNGDYTFAGLPAGDYQVAQTVPSGFNAIFDADGGDFTIIGDPVAIAVSPGTSVEDQDFTNQQPGSISGTVFADTNNNGLGDVPLSNVILTLADENGVAVLDGNDDPITTTTDANGSYTFENVPPGTYQVIETQPAGYDSVSDFDGEDLDINGDVIPIVVLPGGSVTGQNFVEIQLGTIIALVLADTTGDGVGDTVIPGVTVTLLDESGDPVFDGNGVPITGVTGPTGLYTFNNVPPGSYTVRETDPDGYISISSNDLPAVVTPGGSAFVTFTDTQLVSISGTVLVDTTGDGLGDTPQSGVVITLLDENGVPVLDESNALITTVTATDGTYSFNDLPAGSYQVGQTVPSGFFAIGDIDGGDLEVNGDEILIVLPPGQSSTGQDFVNTQYGVITGSVTIDTTGDNVGNDPQEGVTVSLLDGNGVVVDTTTTGPDGSYTFTDVPPGDYSITQDVPLDFTAVDDFDGDDFTVIGNVTPITMPPGGLIENQYFVNSQFASIAGNVFEDLNGLDDGIVNGTGTNAGGIHINLVDPIDNTVIASIPVNVDGTYLFTATEGVLINSSYQLVLTANVVPTGGVLAASTLPTTWIATGEHLGAGPGSDGVVNGILAVATTVGAVEQANFGINQVPDLTPVVTATPNIMNGPTDFTLRMRIAELHNVETNGPIVFRVPKDSRWTLREPYDNDLIELEGDTMNNDLWIYSENNDFHIFTSKENVVIAPGGFSFVGIKARWESVNQEGIYTISINIDSGSGSENRFDNNADAEKVLFFNE